MSIQIKRIYEDAAEGDGKRVLVDRLWPRGVSKEEAKLDEWMKDVAPSTDLREWYGHDPARYEEFAKKYRKELADSPEAQVAVQQLLAWQKDHVVTLLYGAKDTKENQAVVLAEYLKEKAG